MSFPDDQKVRFPQVVGSGEAAVFIGGQQIKAKWTKSSAAAVTTFTDTRRQAHRPVAGADVGPPADAGVGADGGLTVNPSGSLGGRR